MFNLLKNIFRKDTRPVFLGASGGFWIGSFNLLPVTRKGKTPVADALAAMGGKPGEKISIKKHYADNGIWHPVILDPMGDKELEFDDQWIADQKVEKKLLVALGESLSY